MNIIDAALENDVRKVVALSTDKACNPINLYGASKLFGEALARAFAGRSGTEHVALRLGHVYGPGEGSYLKLIPETIRRVLAGEDISGG